MIQPTDTAPDFELHDQDGQPVRLGAVVLGASPDPVAKVKRFQPKTHDEQVLGVLAGM